MKNLVAYFSASGTTKKVAEKLANVVNGDLYQIEPEIRYTPEDLNWMDNNSRSSIEMRDHSSRPEIKDGLKSIDEYDTIYLGFPVWWYVAPTIINTFLEKYDFSGKNIIVFATSGSSGLGKTIEELKPSCSIATNWLGGDRLKSSISEEELREWVNKF